ncbi:hypothetical protein [Symbioplanes lichenis]|uniref:hypothetical protein n=1 Tax=Symbioplanes lichenis TaxID=1629072 RepID=UPI0027386585|nr:hypothetical protein [Actinoplanes lichenis]
MSRRNPPNKQQGSKPVDGGLDAGEHRLTFSFRFADRGYRGAWSWPGAAEWEEIVNFLCDVGASTWHEVRAQLFSSNRGSHRKHHTQHVETLAPEAQERINALRHTEKFGFELFRFRLGSRQRLWGYTKGGVFYVLWWDAEHKVYPVGRE